MNLNALREAFSIGRKYAGGDLDYHGRVGFFKLYTPKDHPWGDAEELRLLGVLSREAEKATNSIRKLGFRRQVHNLAIIDESKMKDNPYMARSKNAGLASDKGHGMLISRSAVQDNVAARILVHEWAHKYWYQLTKEEQAQIAAVYDSLVVDPLVEQDAWKRIEKSMSNNWIMDMKVNTRYALKLSFEEITKDIKFGKDGDMLAYLNGLGANVDIEGTIKKPIENILSLDRPSNNNNVVLDIGDEVLLRKRQGGMWKIYESRKYGNISSRYLSNKMVMDYIEFKPETRPFEAIKAIISKGSIALVDQIPEHILRTVARNTIVNIMGYVPQGEFGSDYEDRANSLLRDGLKEAIDSWLMKLKSIKGHDINKAFLALKKVVKDRLDMEPFIRYQRSITKQQMANKRSAVRRKSLVKKGAVHSAYGASNVSEFWATLVEYGAMGHSLDKASWKLLRTIGR